MVDKNRLMGHIISKGYSQRTLSEKIGVSKNTLKEKEVWKTRKLFLKYR